MVARGTAPAGLAADPLGRSLAAPLRSGEPVTDVCHNSVEVRSGPDRHGEQVTEQVTEQLVRRLRAVSSRRLGLGRHRGGGVRLGRALQHREVPPNLHFETPNPFIPWPTLPVEVVTSLRPWPAGDTPRVGGVSSKGLTAR